MTIDNTVYKEVFTEHYAEGKAVWDIGRPQAPFIEIAGKIKGPILDVGCGTGSVALFFAEKGHAVTAIDFADQAIERAKQRAAGKNLNITFLVKDAFTLIDSDWRFPSIIDCGLFHIFADDYDGYVKDIELRRSLYIKALEHVIEPDGKLYLMAAKDRPKGSALSGYSLAELQKAFAEGWEFESIKEFVAEVTPEEALEHPGADWTTWFAVIKRKA